MPPIVRPPLRRPFDAIARPGGAPLWLVGETFAGAHERELIASYLGAERLDGQFDFPLFWTIRDTFINDASFRDLEGATAASAAAYGDALALMSPFAGNHDVERFATALARNDLGPWGGTVDVLAQTSGSTPERWDIINPFSMAMAFTLTLPGVPLIYQGDELALGGSNDPDNRRMMPGSLSADQTEVLRRIRELGVARREHPVIAIGQRRELWIDDDVYVQGRWRDGGGAGNAAIIAMNKGEEARTDLGN
jgi:glycosidase